ncbi:hypothetical protein N7524_011878 [Penicillium chrysogenum]|nr:hypothetical protein N7524_011878 [Penicillium chrysogenum]
MSTDRSDVAFDPWIKFSGASVKKCCLAFIDTISRLPEDQMAKVSFASDGSCKLRGTRAMNKGDSVFMLDSGEVDVKDSFLVNISNLACALSCYERDAQAKSLRSRISVEQWIPAEFPTVLERLNNFLDDVNNVRCDRAVVHNEVVAILRTLP